MKTIVCTLLVLLTLVLKPETGLCGQRTSKIVTRVDNVSVEKKGRKIVIHAEGMAATPGVSVGGVKLVPRGQDHQLNKDGLLEYDLVYNASEGYTGFKLKPAKASFKESSVPPEAKGVRVFSELNQMDGILPEPKRKK